MQTTGVCPLSQEVLHSSTIRPGTKSSQTPGNLSLLLACMVTPQPGYYMANSSQASRTDCLPWQGAQHNLRQGPEPPASLRVQWCPVTLAPRGTQVGKQTPTHCRKGISRFQTSRFQASPWWKGDFRGFK